MQVYLVAEEVSSTLEQGIWPFDDLGTTYAIKALSTDGQDIEIWYAPDPQEVLTIALLRCLEMNLVPLNTPSLCLN